MTAWTDLPTPVRRAVDALIEASGLPLRRVSDPYREGPLTIVPLTGPEGRVEAVVDGLGGASLRPAS